MEINLQRSRRAFGKADALFALVSIAVLGVYVWAAFSVYWKGELQNFDYGVFFQGTSLLSRFQPPLLTNGGYHLWSDDQSFFLLSLAFVHYFALSHFLLIAFHTAAIVGVGVVAYLLLRPLGWPAVMSALAIWLSPALVNMSIDLMHPEAFATLFLVATGSAAILGRRLAFFGCLLLALSTKIDVAITAGVFCFLALLRPGLFRLRRRDFALGLALSAAIFCVDFAVVLPYYKLETCRWLEPGRAWDQTSSIPSDSWFRTLYDSWSDPSFYSRVLFREDAGWYLATLLWPVLIIGWRSFPFPLLPLAAALLNILAGTHYLTSLWFHYDHSSFAGVLIALLLALRRSARPLLLSGIWLFGAGSYALIAAPGLRLSPKQVISAEFWQVQKSAHVRCLELADDVIPKDAVLSVYYTLTPYIMLERENIFMYPNPIMFDYFGITAECSEMRPAPAVDLVILRNDHKERDDLQAMGEILATQFERHEIPEAQLALFLKRESSSYPLLLESTRHLERACGDGARPE